jgi:peptidyl-prolyl cis-trans isomerase C
MPLRVDGEAIPDAAIQYELDRLVKFYAQYMPPEQIKAQMDALRKRAREQAIGAKLLIREADRLDLRVPTDDVEARLAEMEKNAGGGDVFERKLRDQKISMAELRAGIERGRKVDLLVERITADVTDPTEEEIRLHFEQHSQEYARPDRAQAQHILLRPASHSEADRAVAVSRLEELKRKIQDGADFAQMAATYSDCPSGKKTGGSLGWFSRGMTVPEIDNAIFALQMGELSEIVETRLGYHLLKKIGEETGRAVELAEVSDRVRDFLRHAKRGEALSAYVEELKKKATIEDDEAKARE